MGRGSEAELAAYHGDTERLSWGGVLVEIIRS